MQVVHILWVGKLALVHDSNGLVGMVLAHGSKGVGCVLGEVEG